MTKAKDTEAKTEHKAHKEISEHKGGAGAKEECMMCKFVLIFSFVVFFLVFIFAFVFRLLPTPPVKPVPAAETPVVTVSERESKVRDLGLIAHPEGIPADNNMPK